MVTVMNGEIPSVPITTLAGISTLTDLLPEMPLPAPLPQTLSNKTLLFHPRVAEEANILLGITDETLLPQLIHSLSQNTTTQIDLKEKFVNPTPHPQEPPSESPQLLKAILFREPDIFNGNFSGRNDINWQPPPPLVDGRSVLEGTNNSLLSSSIPNHDPQLHSSLPNASINELGDITKASNISEVPPAYDRADLFSPGFSTHQIPSVPPTPQTPSTPASVIRVETPAVPTVVAAPSPATAAPPEPATPNQETPAAPVNEPPVSDPSSSPQSAVNPSLKLDKKLPIIPVPQPDLFPSIPIHDPNARFIKKDFKQETISLDKTEETNEWLSKLKPRNAASNKKKYYEGSGSENDSDNEKVTPKKEIIPKAKVQKIERCLIPVLEKLNVEELLETNTYQRFNKTVSDIFEGTEDADLGDDGDNVCEEVIIQKYVLQDLVSEAAKLKTLGAMATVPTGRTVRLLTILERNIRDGTNVSPISDPSDPDDNRMFMELAMDRVMRAADASLAALYILTSPNMNKQTYLEDVIDRIMIFTKYQLHNTVYPAFDPVYRVENKESGIISSGRKKRGHAKEVREKSMLAAYQKLTEVVSLLAELLDMQRLTDNAVLHASSMGISPFFVENVNDLQLAALKLVTTIFAKYEKHRKLLLDDILASMARLPSSKRSLRSYRLSSEEYIQMLTALVLQLIQCMVNLPNNLDFKSSDTSLNPEVVIGSRFKTTRMTATNFLYVFLGKCSSKSEDIDYRPIFENFVQDLLTTVNKPEWPAAELMLSVLGSLLVNNFVNKSLDMSLRVASLDYLGVVAARLRKDSVVSHLKLSTIDQLIKEIKAEELKEEDGPTKSDGSKAVENDEERTLFLQRVLLDYLAMRGQTEPSIGHSRHFYIAQWYFDLTAPTPSPPPPKKSNPKRNSTRKRRKVETSEEESSSSEEEFKKEKKHAIDPLEALKQGGVRKEFLVSKIRPFQDNVKSDGTRTHILQSYVDYSSAELVARYLASKRPFSQSFDTYLRHIIKVLTESSVLIRTKAMKCLTSIVEVDPSVLGLKEMQLGVSHSFLDHSTSVREAAVDLVGKFILSRPELIPKYYDMLVKRILDTGVSVRKRVIKILKDVCMEYPDFPKVPEICVKIIRRVNDEDGIRKLVLEVFQNMWFTPVKKSEENSEVLQRKVLNITDVVAASNDVSIEWFEQLLMSLFKPRDDKEDATKGPVEIPKSMLQSCKQIVDCLVDMVLKLDGSGGNAMRLVSCLVMIHLLAKIHPQLLVHHATTLQPYLSLKCQTHTDYQMISSVARTLELVVPLIEHPSEIFLSRLEEDSVKLMMQQDAVVVLSCVSCLSSVVNNVSRNYALIRDCLKKYHGFLMTYRQWLESGDSAELIQTFKPTFRRSLFVVGLLLRFFDFTDPEVLGINGTDPLPASIKDEVLRTFWYYLNLNEDSRYFTLKAIGNICIRHYEIMMGSELKPLYNQVLTDDSAPVNFKTLVLNNVECYLQEEEKRMIKQDLEWAKLSKKENLKEMGDLSSGMASTVIQIYLKEILESFFHPNVAVRNAALRVIQLILSQGLVHPVQIVPYLICMSTDEEKTVSNSADKQLQEIEKKYPGFIHMKAQSGIRLSFRLRKIIQNGVGIVRGFREKEGEPYPGALNNFLYSNLRSKQQKRALVLSLLKQFDESSKASLEYLLYLADNMAFFPYQVQDEPLFIIHHIDIIISVTGTNLLQSFKEGLLPVPREDGAAPGEVAPDEDEDEDEESLLERLPENTAPLQQVLNASQGCLLLLVLKQHLKSLYGFNDVKITQYSPTESSKVYEKSVNRKSHSKFNPKALLNKLKEGDRPDYLDEEGRKQLVEEYLEFKTLIMNLDPDEEDEDEGTTGGVAPGPGGTPVKPNPERESNIIRIKDLIARKASSEQSGEVDGKSPPKVPKLTILASKGEVRTHRHHKSRNKTEKHRKHKRSRRVLSEEDSDDQDSDPDFQA